MRKIIQLTAIFMIGLGAGFNSAMAQDISMLPDGQTLIVLSATERVEVEQDVLQAMLRVEIEDADNVQLQSDINEKMAQALDAANPDAALEVATGRYSVYRVNSSPQLRSKEIWRGSQTLTLTSKDASAILAMVSRLQEMGLLLGQLSYTLSSEKADEVRESLLESAIQKAKNTAQRTATALGKSEVEIASISIDESFNIGRPVMERVQAMSSAASFDAPVAQASETQVSLTVRVQAIAQ
ncbi:MAG: SIMPL domain-containing protein [Pseudohongiellaceae bacterium]|nr:SIMPL domain-containing protein [Pseudohongiellaceae bacterium]